MVNSALFKDIYSQGVQQEPSQEIVDKISEKISTISTFPISKVKALIPDINRRLKFLDRQLKVVDIADTYLQKDEITSLRALKHLNNYIINKKIDTFCFDPQWITIINEIETRTDPNKLNDLFNAFKSIQWIYNYKHLEMISGVQISQRSAELNTLFQSLTLPTQHQLRDYFVKLSEIEEEGVGLPVVAVFQTLDRSSSVIGISQGAPTLGSGSSGEVRLAEKKGMDTKPATPIAFKGGDNLREEFGRWREFKQRLTQNELKYFVNDYSNVVEPNRLSGIEHPKIEFKPELLTRVHGIDDENFLTIAQKEKLALGWLDNLHRFTELDILVLNEAFQGLFYKTEGDQVTPFFSECDSLINIGVIRNNRTLLVPFVHFMKKEIGSYGPHGPVLEYNILLNALNRLVIREPLLNADRFNDEVTYIKGLHAEISRFILGKMLYRFITGKLPFKNVVPDYTPENQLIRKNGLLSAGCSETLVTQIMDCLSFNPAPVSSLDKMVLLKTDNFIGYFMDHFEGSVHDFIFKKIPASRRQKEEMAHSLLSSLHILHKHGYILSDMRSVNMLYSLDSKRAKLVLSDYEGLLNFKKLLEDPKGADLNVLYSHIFKWSPDLVIFNEYHSIHKHVKQLIRKQATHTAEQIKAGLEWIYAEIHQIERFIVGQVLSFVFTGNSPYNKTLIKTLHSDYTMLDHHCSVLDGNTYESFPDILKHYTSPKTREVILGLLSPDPTKRTSFEEIGAYINENL